MEYVTPSAEITILLGYLTTNRVAAREPTAPISHLARGFFYILVPLT